MPEIKVQLNHPQAKMPSRGTDRAQCIDLYAAESVSIPAGGTALVDLGLRLILPKGYGLEFRERSGLASRGILIGAGIIDEDYHGNLKAVVRFMSSQYGGEPFRINAGDKIVQAELVERISIDLTEVEFEEFEQLSQDSQRGEKGFGSTG
jgi:dUTP pyrophosphatase